MDKINKNFSFQFSWSLYKTYTDILTVVSLDPGDSLNQKQKTKTGMYLFLHKLLCRALTSMDLFEYKLNCMWVWHPYNKRKVSSTQA